MGTQVCFQALSALPDPSIQKLVSSSQLPVGQLALCAGPTPCMPARHPSPSPSRGILGFPLQEPSFLLLYGNQHSNSMVGFLDSRLLPRGKQGPCSSLITVA